MNPDYTDAEKAAYREGAILGRDAFHHGDLVISELIDQAKKTPYFHLAGYMDRWWVTAPYEGKDPDAKRSGEVRLHHILRGDLDADMHDHPWPSTSIPIRGWFIERTPMSQDQHPSQDATCYRDQLVTAGQIVRRHSANFRHKIIEVSPGGVWTLFITGQWAKEWGFHTPAGFVYWRTYLNQPGPKPKDGEVGAAR